MTDVLDLYVLDSEIESNSGEDPEVIAQQMNSNQPIDNELLKSIGITAVGHRLRLLTKLNSNEPLPIPSPEKKSKVGIISCVAAPGPAPSVDNMPSLEAWFLSNQLSQYTNVFIEAGFEDLKQLLEVHNGDFRITDEILREEMGMDKVGHVRKIIMKLDDEVARMPGGRKGQMAAVVEKTGRLEACKKCVIM